MLRSTHFKFSGENIAVTINKCSQYISSKKLLCFTEFFEKKIKASTRKGLHPWLKQKSVCAGKCKTLPTYFRCYHTFYQLMLYCDEISTIKKTLTSIPYKFSYGAGFYWSEEENYWIQKTLFYITVENYCYPKDLKDKILTMSNFFLFLFILFRFQGCENELLLCTMMVKIFSRH